MLDFPRWKVWLTIVTVVVGVALALPSLLPEGVRQVLPARYAATRINLGLDLKGGSHLLLEADIDDVAKQRLERMEESVRTEMRRADPRIEIGDISTVGGELSFFVRDTRQLDAAVENVRRLTTGIGATGQRDWNVAVRDSSRIVMTPTVAGLNQEVSKAMETARTVVSKRIDPDGTREVTVVRQGDNRILVQVPGLQDPEGLKTLLGKTAKLEFKLVDQTADPAKVAQGNASPGSQILAYPDDPAGLGKIAVLRRVMVSGDQLIDANQGFDQQTNAPIVNIRFNGQGGRRFARVTQENVGKPFAIILDNVVISAPNINEPILGGQVIYMLVTYFRFGVYTTLALFLNGILVLGGMAMFNATLTLPGIAGFVLTIGAAVDANVLINERIREEIRRGRQTIQSVEFGYKEASTAIFDANITNVISALILFWFGSGPIKGFAVVLAIGIATSVFTGVTFTRLLVADYLQRNRPKSLNL
ncbi:MAG: preprotein translocase subunit SecD [Sphingomonadales bacterium]|nr:preprotein translocase subunit SecD [Sphingomonadales bacterium]